MIEGKNINLRTFKESDLAEYLEHTSRLSIIGEHWPIGLMTEKQLRKQYEENGFWGPDGGRMLITDKSDKMLGNINYFRGIPYCDGYEVGYRIFRPKDRGKGLMTEALSLFVSYFFNLKTINRIQLGTDPENIASRKIAEKCGFKHEGTLRGSYYFKGEYKDTELYSILRKDWEALQK